MEQKKRKRKRKRDKMGDALMPRGKGRPKKEVADEAETIFAIPTIREMREEMAGIGEILDEAIKKEYRCPGCNRQFHVVSPENKMALARTKSVMLQKQMGFEKDAAVIMAQRWNAEQARRAVGVILNAVRDQMNPDDWRRKLAKGLKVEDLIGDYRSGVVGAVKEVLAGLEMADEDGNG